MAWIESHQELGRHPKTRKLARALDISRPCAVGHLHYLWWWALDFAQDGDLSRYDAEVLAEAALWDGDPGAFVSALLEAGFLDPDSQLHDWHDYAGKILDQRRANADKQRRWRERQHQEQTGPEARNGHITVTSPLRNGATVPNLTIQNHRDIPTIGDNSSILHDALNDPAAEPPPPPRALKVVSTPTTPVHGTDASPKPRASHTPTPNLLWDALVEVMGYTPTTPREKSNWGGVIRQLKAANATPQDVRRRGAHYRERYRFDRDGKPIALTVNALLNHWSELAIEPPKPTNGHMPRAAPIEPPPPRPYTDFDLLKEPEMAPELLGDTIHNGHYPMLNPPPTPPHKKETGS